MLGMGLGTREMLGMGLGTREMLGMGLGTREILGMGLGTRLVLRPSYLLDLLQSNSVTLTGCWWQQLQVNYFYTLYMIELLSTTLLWQLMKSTLKP